MMGWTFGETIEGLDVDGRPLRAAVFDEHAVRAVAGLTMALGAVAFAYAYFAKVYAPIQAVTVLFFAEFALRARRWPAREPARMARARAGAAPRPAVGLGQAEAVRLDARPRDGAGDGDHHQRRHPRRAAARRSACCA